MREYLVALCMFCYDYHDGQWSKYYRIGCLAQKYLQRWYQIADVYAWMDASFIKEENKESAQRMYHNLVLKYGK